MSDITVYNHNVSDIERMAASIAKSRLFGIQNPEQAVALCLIAQSEGRHPASAAQDYHIIKGRPSKKSDAMLRDFLGSGGKVKWIKLDDTEVCATFSHPSGGAVEISWDMGRAERAGIKNPMWNKYPRQMLRARVVSEGVRTVFPMATSGMYVPEEVEEFAEQVKVKNDVQKVIEGDVTQSQPNPSKASSRDEFEHVIETIRGASSEQELREYWSTKPWAGMPKDWVGEISDEKNVKLDELNRTPSQTVSAQNSLDDQFPGDLPAEALEAAGNLRAG